MLKYNKQIKDFNKHSFKDFFKRFKEVRELLVKFESKDKAVDYLIKETGISKEECSNAYDIIMKRDLDKQ